jgi:O-antigen/teichoic acid export membrane protein
MKHGVIGISSDGCTDKRALPQSEAKQLVRRAASGAAALLIRQVLVYGSNIGGGVILARLLSPQQFGFYGIALFCVVFLNIFGGTGFSANLIRTEEHPSLREFRAVFTGQQMVVGSIFIGIWIAAPFLASRYQMRGGGTEFFRLIGLSLVLTSFMVISQVRMERELAFGKLAVVEVVQGFAFNLVAVGLAWRGLGVSSLALALVIRAGCGAVLSNTIEPWAMGWLWDAKILKSHLRFGLALQAGQFTSLAKDSITPLFVGLYLGAAMMGYVTWANTLAAYPTMILMPLQRLYLPFFARLQSNREELRRYAGHAMWMTNAIAAPLVVITIALARPITSLIFGDKWIVALPLFYCFAAANIVAASSTPLLGLLNAIGKSHLTLILSLLWMIATWLLGVPLMIQFGLIGLGAAVIAVQIINVGLYRAVWKEVRLSVLPTFWPCWPIALLIGVALLLEQWWVPIRDVKWLAGASGLGLMLYVAVLGFGFPERTRTVARLLGVNRR